jgi:hypothetical protein
MNAQAQSAVLQAGFSQSGKSCKRFARVAEKEYVVLARPSFRYHEDRRCGSGSKEVTSYCVPGSFFFLLFLSRKLSPFISRM